MHTRVKSCALPLLREQAVYTEHQRPVCPHALQIVLSIIFFPNDGPVKTVLVSTDGGVENFTFSVESLFNKQSHAARDGIKAGIDDFFVVDFHVFSSFGARSLVHWGHQRSRLQIPS